VGQKCPDLAEKVYQSHQKRVSEKELKEISAEDLKARENQH